MLRELPHLIVINVDFLLLRDSIICSSIFRKKCITSWEQRKITTVTFFLTLALWEASHQPLNFFIELCPIKRQMTKGLHGGNFFKISLKLPDS